MGFGRWEGFLKANSEFAFDERQAQKYIRIAKHKELILSLFKGSGVRLSVDKMAKAITDATPEQIARAEEASRPKEVEKEADTVLGKVDGKIPLTPSEIEQAEEGEYTEIVEETKPEPLELPKPDVEPEEEYTELDQLRDVIDELAEENTRLQAYKDHMKAIFDDYDHIAAEIRDIEKKQALIDGLQGTINGLTNENAAMKKELNRLDRRCKILDKKLKEAGSHE